MQLLVSLSTRCGQFTSPLFAPSSDVRLLILMRESVQELRESNNTCGLCLPMAKWLDAIRLQGSRIGPERFDDIMQEFSLDIQDANTRGIIWDRGEECLEATAVFSNLPIYKGSIKVLTLAELTELTKDLTLSEAWQG